MLNEFWKQIKGYEGLYEVSNLGRIKSLERKILTRNNTVICKKSKILKNHINNNGYYSVSLTKDGKLKTFTVHRLVAEAFIKNEHNYNIVNHLDGVKINNESSNLEWCTQKQNMEHASQNNLMDSSLFGNEIKIIKMHKNGFSLENISIKFNSSPKAIKKLLKKYGIVIKNSRKEKMVNKEYQLLDLMNYGFYNNEIAELYGCNRGLIANYRSKFVKIGIYNELECRKRNFDHNREKINLLKSLR